MFGGPPGVWGGEALDSIACKFMNIYSTERGCSFFLSDGRNGDFGVADARRPPSWAEALFFFLPSYNPARQPL